MEVGETNIGMFGNEETGKEEKEVHFVTPEAPKFEGPISVPINIPVDKEYFEVADIIKFAEEHYDIIFVTDKDIDSTERTKRELYSDRYSSIKQYINRHLQGKPVQRCQGERKKYPRAVVHEFFNNCETQLYFLQIKCKSYEKTLKDAKSKQKENLSAGLEKAQSEIDQILGSTELRERLKESQLRYLQSFDDCEDDIETTIASMAEDYKKKILMQFLLDSFIDLNEDLLKGDLKLLPNLDDGLAINDDQLWAIHRMENLHNYYTGKCDPMEAFPGVRKAIMRIVKETVEEVIKETVEETVKETIKQLSKKNF